MPALDAYLYEVTFVVVDVETTGSTPAEAALIELGAVAFRGGECRGMLDTLVDPGVPLPPFISELTGITDSMLAGAPPPSAVLPAFLSLADDNVLVGHNVGFDVGFLDAALTADGWPPLSNHVVDTLALARRLVREEVPDCALATLAATLHLEHRPAHRALADALATADLLHRLIEAATGYDVLRLGELLTLPDRLPPIPTDAAGALIPA
jgi:DNA polymerase III subunit epsilon